MIKKEFSIKDIRILKNLNKETQSNMKEIKKI